MPPLPIVLICVYGLIVFGGGIMGFLQAGSKMSLIAGSLSGVVLAVAFWMGLRGNGVTGLYIAHFTALLLAIVFVIRFLKTKKFMPSGMMLVISLAAFVYFGLAVHGKV